MDIEEELSEFLTSAEKGPGKPRRDRTPRKIRDEDPALRERNAEIVRSYFGFGSGPNFWPTLEDLAAEQLELSTRERVRQIIARAYTQRLPQSPLPVARRAAAVLEKSPFWLESEYLEELQERQLCGPLEHAIGILNYLQTQGLVKPYAIRLPDMVRVTRGTYHESEERFIVTDEKARSLSKDLAAARSLPGRLGLAQLSAVSRRGAKVDRDALAQLLRVNPDAWTGLFDDELWFYFEDRENVLVNFASKTFAVTDEVPLPQLAGLLTNALHRRSADYDYPPQELIERWISQSRHFSVENGQVTFAGEPGELTEIEAEIAGFAAGKGDLTGPEIRDHLQTFDFSIPNINASVYHSPILVIDRSAGRGNFTFRLVSQSSKQAADKLDRYQRFLAKFATLGSTDRESKGLARREQAYLVEWVFDEKKEGSCALCGRSFARRALVVAHKKKRSRCTDTERLDPHIVFPLCTFGCDHLYEHGYLTVRDHCVSVKKQPKGETEQKRAQQLSGRSVDQRWTEGPASYFDNG